jgi:hypothetical protein
MKNVTPISKGKRQSTLESWMMANGKVGEVFYTEKPDRLITASASFHGRKVLTERCVCVGQSTKNPTAISVTKVTLL